MTIQTLEKTAVRSFCDSIKLSDFDQIQSYGVLLVVDDNLLISECSENVADLLGTGIQEILNQPLSRFVRDENSKDDLTTLLKKATNKFTRMIWQANAKQLPIFLKASENVKYILLEIEVDTASDTITQSKIENYINVNIEIKNGQSIQELCQTAADEIKQITNYNRVIIYKFDENDQSGIVIGQALDDGMDSYLGLAFPATDIPLGVRKMYLSHPLRYIPDIASPNIKIVSKANEVKNYQLDLSAINLRMLAPIHAEYLSNMNIKSTSSIALIHDKKLWGLIVFHNKNAKSLSVNDRRFLQFIAKSLSAQVFAKESVAILNEKRKIRLLEGMLNSHLGEVDSLATMLEEYHNDMMQLVSAEGMSIYTVNKIINYGTTPTNEQVIDLVQWLEEKNLSNIYATSVLPLEYEPCLRYKTKACGLLAFRMVAVEQGYIIFYKPERVETTIWAGDPNQTLTINQSVYSPRSTFERYVEQITNTSTIWTERQIESAHFIQSILAKQQLQDMLKIQIQNDKLATVTMLAAGVAHEINNPLGYLINNINFLGKRMGAFQKMLSLCQKLPDNANLVQTEVIQKTCDDIASFIKDNKLTEKFSDVTDLLTESMEGLLEIQSIVNDMKSLITKPQASDEIIDINSCVQFAIATVLDQTKFKFILNQHFSDSVTIKGNYLQIQTVFVHLFRNAVQAIGENGEISVSTAVDNGDIVITFRDNGCGIEPQNLKNLFSPFFTVESAGTGRGLGLTLAYSIAKMHGGSITAKSKPGTGSEFIVRLPKAS